MTVRLFDTARREVVDFEAGPVVRMYTCGITPYDSTHLGHAATYLAYDVLQRRLEELGHEVRMVRNVTDVDDDILRKARELGVYYLDLADEEMARFSADMDALGLLPAVSEPRATSAIPDIQSIDRRACWTNGHAYRAGEGVYFDISSLPAFGSVSHYDRDEMVRLAARTGRPPRGPGQGQTRSTSSSGSHPLPDEPAWDSPWGRGRPGWHIECSALAIREPGDDRSTCTAAGPTSSSRTTSARRRWPRRYRRAASSATGCTPGWSATRATRCQKSLGNLVFVTRPAENLGPGARDPPRCSGPSLPFRLGVARRPACRGASRC